MQTQPQLGRPVPIHMVWMPGTVAVAAIRERAGALIQK
jgi:hypothetical protein